MHFGKTLATACSTFAITNIDDLFVLVAFFAESAVDSNLTPLVILVGQYLGFTVIMAISMVGFAAAQAIPAEPIGFLGFVPLLLGVWKLLDVVFARLSTHKPNSTPESPAAVNGDTAESTTSTDTTLKPPATARVKRILKVASITLMNGGDNISTYIPVFSQASRSELPVYITTYYLLLGLWCLLALGIMRQRHILALAQRYARTVVPLLYVGLGTFIVVKSRCFPWSVGRINGVFDGGVAVLDPGGAIMAGGTAVVMLACLAGMLWWKLSGRECGAEDVEVQMQEVGRDVTSSGNVEEGKSSESVRVDGTSGDTDTAGSGI
ncbi:hypothetical protein TWF696_002055 [Orbilia brochopaga]|uniref:Cadmium resistance transporter n=1 Tax=Orbilia brochopaga TaxID=3140254 RepID=A0AAV9UAZ0_9PEZI